MVDPRRTETAEIADIHLQVKPGTDALLLAAMIGVLVQEDLDRARLARARTPTASSEVLPHFAALAGRRLLRERCGVPEELVRAAARRIAAADERGDASRTSACR